VTIKRDFITMSTKEFKALKKQNYKK